MRSVLRNACAVISAKKVEHVVDAWGKIRVFLCAFYGKILLFPSRGNRCLKLKQMA